MTATDFQLNTDASQTVGPRNYFNDCSSWQSVFNVSTGFQRSGPG